jgi:magnesium transporter
MNKRCFAGSGDLGFAEVPEDVARGVIGEGCVWIDVEDFEDAEIAEWLRSLDFSLSAARAAEKLSGRTRVVSLAEEALFELPALASDIGSERVPVAFLIRPHLCVTVHREPVEALERIRHHLTGAEAHVAESPSSLVAVLLAGLSVRAMEVADELRRKVLDLQEQLERDPDQVEAAEIQELSSRIRALDAVISERIVVLDRVRLLEPPPLDLSGNKDFQSAVSDTQYLDRLIERLEKRLANVREQYALYQQDRMNKRLAVLTTLSAVFLPLTLIAGIYGMNFEYMPELGFRYAYFLTMAVMAVLGIGMIVWFRSRGWFD